MRSQEYIHQWRRMCFYLTHPNQQNCHNTLVQFPNKKASSTRVGSSICGLELAALFLLAMVLVSCNEGTKTTPEFPSYRLEATCAVEECGITELYLRNSLEGTNVYEHTPGIMPIGTHEIWSGMLSPSDASFHYESTLDCSSCVLTLTLITPSGDNCSLDIEPPGGSFLPIVDPMCLP